MNEDLIFSERISGGQHQRVALARSGNSLLLDETVNKTIPYREDWSATMPRAASLCVSRSVKMRRVLRHQ